MITTLNQLMATNVGLHISRRTECSVCHRKSRRTSFCIEDEYLETVLQRNFGKQYECPATSGKETCGQRTGQLTVDIVSIRISISGHPGWGVLVVTDRREVSGSINTPNLLNMLQMKVGAGKYAPAPWDYRLSSIGYPAYVNEGGDEHKNVCALMMPVDKDACERVVANARLIAAAPELLEACKSLVASIKGCHEWSMMVRPIVEMERVIAKAEGQLLNKL